MYIARRFWGSNAFWAPRVHGLFKVRRKTLCFLFSGHRGHLLQLELSEALGTTGGGSLCSLKVLDVCLENKGHSDREAGVTTPGVPGVSVSCLVPDSSPAAYATLASYPRSLCLGGNFFEV